VVAVACIRIDEPRVGERGGHAAGHPHLAPDLLRPVDIRRAPVRIHHGRVHHHVRLQSRVAQILGPARTTNAQAEVILCLLAWLYCLQQHPRSHLGAAPSCTITHTTHNDNALDHTLRLQHGWYSACPITALLRKFVLYVLQSAVQDSAVLYTAEHGQQWEVGQSPGLRSKILMACCTLQCCTVQCCTVRSREQAAVARSWGLTSKILVACCTVRCSTVQVTLAQNSAVQYSTVS